MYVIIPTTLVYVLFGTAIPTLPLNFSAIIFILVTVLFCCTWGKRLCSLTWFAFSVLVNDIVVFLILT